MKSFLVDCIESIIRHSLCCLPEIILVDNASRDGSVDEIRKQFPQVICIANNENYGFAGANNQGAKLAKGEYLLFLNPDTIMHSGSLEYLVTFMDNNKDVGACGPKLLNEDGTTQRSVRRFPSYRGVLYRFTFLKYFNIFKNKYQNWLSRDFDHKSQKDVDQLMGAALLIRKSIIDKVGGFDERFFMYYEEVDLCYRIKHNGGRVVFLPQVSITHLGGRSSGQIPASKRIMMLRSMLKFFRKHRGNKITSFFNCIFKPGIILREIIDIIGDSAIYVFSIVVFNKQRRKKTSVKISNSILFLLKLLTCIFKL